MKPILLLGAEGQIGWELQRTLTTVGTVHSYNRQTLDITDKMAVAAAVAAIQPAVIVNAAAYTAVDAAENDEERAWRLNAAAPALLAALAAKQGSLLVHYSTDYVFDGTATLPYTEADTTCPVSVYGASKLAGEEAIALSDAPHLILRTRWIYANRGKNFLLTMLKLARQRQHLSVVADQIGAPTWARLVAQATAHAIDRTLRAPQPADHWGTYHLTCGGKTSWHGFATALFTTYQQLTEAYGLEPAPMPTVAPITTAEYPTAAARPAYSVLAQVKFREHFDLELVHWQEALRLCLHELMMAQTTAPRSSAS